MNTELKTICQKLVDYSLKAGADACDVVLKEGKSLSLSAQGGDIDKYKVSGSKVIGVRTIKDNRVGLSYTEAFDDSSLEFSAKASVENALNSEVNENENITIAATEQIVLAETQVDSSSMEEKINFTLNLEKEVKARDKRVKAVPYNGLSEAQSSSYYLSSLNVFTFHQENYLSCYTSALLEEGTDSSMHYHGVMGRSLRELDYNICIEESLEHAGKWMQGKPLKTGHYDIMFTVDAFSEVLGCFSNMFSGKAAMEKTNPFGQRQGEQVMGESITVTDIPKYQDSFFKSYFDSEGLIQKDLVLIENGVLKSFYHNTATAKYFNVDSTGHGARGPKGSLGVSGTTRVISPGKISEERLAQGEYFEIHSLQGLHSGANAISGEFSFAATGYLCKDGVRVRPVKGVTVSGNFHRMLLNLKQVGDKIHGTTYKDFFSPLLRFEGMSVAGE